MPNTAKTPAKKAVKKPVAKVKATRKPTKKTKPAASVAPAVTTPVAPPTPAAPVASAATATPAAAPAPVAKPPLDFAGFMKRLTQVTDGAKLSKATAMLRAEKFKLYAKVEPDHLVGVVKSQTNPDLVYSCRLASDGKYSCGTQNLRACGGLQGSPCKHLLVLIVGLANAGDLDATAARDWTLATRDKQPVFDKDSLAETFLKYKGAEAGEIDWRPTETIPEDFYAM